MKWLVVIAEVYLTVALCEEIYVSNNGVDDDICGVESEPCKTLQHAMDKKERGDIVILDGGSSKQMVYFLNKTQDLRKPIIIRRNNHSNFRPFVKGKFHITMRNFGNSYFSLHGVEVLYFSFSNNLESTNSDIDTTGMAISIDINNCIFRQTILEEKTKAAVNIVIRNSFFVSPAKFDIRKDASQRKSFFKLDNVTFTEDLLFDSFDILGNIETSLTNVILQDFPFHRMSFVNTTLNISDCEFQSAVSLRMVNTNFTMTRTKVVVNKNRFGKIFIKRSKVFFNNSYFIATAVSQPLISVYDSEMFVHSCNFSGIRNKKSEGGAMYLNSTTGAITTSHFLRNKAAIDGGALYIQHSQIIINDSIFEKNKADDSGGAIFVHNSKVSIHNTKLLKNYAKELGGGLYLYKRSEVSVTNTDIKFNRASREAGAIRTHRSQLHVNSTIMAYNSGESVGGVFSESSNVTIQNSKFINNTASQSPSALFYNVNYNKEKIWFTMNNVTVQTLAIPGLPVPDAIWITSPQAKDVQVYIANVNVTLSGSKTRVPSILLTLSAQTNISLGYTCPSNFDASYSKIGRRNKKFQRYIYTLLCNLCSKGTYRLQNSSQKVQIAPVNQIMPIHTQAQCMPCPVGGNCKSYIKSKDHFWGYESEGRVKFLPCPEQYCCSKKDGECTSIKGCAKNRTGKLCGICERGFQVNYFDNRCVPTNSCTSQCQFWFIFVLFGLTYSTLLAYLKDISFFTKYILQILSEKLFSFRHRNIQEDETQLESLDRNQNNSNMFEYTRNDGDFVVIHGSPPTKEVVSANNKYYKHSSRISGILKVLVSFYQIKGLIHIKVENQEEEKSSTLNTLVYEVFNLNIPKAFIKFCPGKGISIVEKKIIKEFLFAHCMLLSALVFLLIAALFYVMRRNRLYYWRYRRFLLRASICCLHVIILGYTIWAKFSLQFINCRNVNGEYILYVNGEIKCYTIWQKINIAFFVLWILPFPLTLCISVRLLQSQNITGRQFFYCVCCPPITIVYLAWTKLGKFRNVQSDTIIREYVCNMFQEPFRQFKNSEKCLFWDTWRLYERLAIAVFSTFFIDPIQRLCFILPIMLLLLVVHLRVKPYKSKFINWMETTSLVSLCFLVGINEFRAFLYMYSYENQENIMLTSTVLNVMEFFSTPVSGFFLFMVWKFSKKIICNMKRCL